jgi:hypothetical protein
VPRIRSKNQRDESADGSCWRLDLSVVELTAEQCDQLLEWIETLVEHLPPEKGTP